MEISIDIPGAYYFGPFRLDPIRRVLHRDGQPVRLPPRLFETLLHLVRNAGRIVEKDELMTAVWPGRTVEDANLSQTIFSLRKALGANGDGDRYIVTAPSRGYRFAAPVRLELASDEDGPAPAPAAAAQPPGEARPVEPLPRPEPVRRRSLYWPIGLVLAVFVAAGAGIGLTRARPVAFDPPPHSVAVLPFTNMSGDPAQDYFSDGLSEELINALSRTPQLRVAARISSFSFKGKAATVTDIGRGLNVATILEGSVRRGESQLRITAQLVDARSGFQIWSRSFDRNPHDLLSVEGDIATAVAASLQVSLLDGETAHMTVGGTDVPEAFDAYLRGMLLLRSNDPAQLAGAPASFAMAIRLDPNYARAYAGRAYALCDLGLDPPVGATEQWRAQTFAEALAAADKAIALAPDLASGHAARGAVLDNGFVKPTEAAIEAAKARELEPGNAAIVGNYAQIEADLGHAEDALAAARLTTTLDPLRPDAWYVLAMVEFQTRQYDQALAALGHERQLRQGNLPPYSMDLLARVQLLHGDAADALRSCAGTTEDYADICFALAAHAVGRLTEAESHVDRLRSGSGQVATYNLAEIYAQWGDREQALTWLERALADHDEVLNQIQGDPLLDPIRNEPRFQAVVRQLGVSG